MADELTPEEKEDLQMVVNKLIGDREGPYWNVQDPNHKAAVKEVAGAMELLHPNTINPLDG